MSVASLAGLDPEAMDGQTVARAVAEREERERPEYVAGGQVAGEAVDLFAESELSWAPGEGFHVLSGHGQVVIREEEAGTWSVSVLPRGGPRLLGQGLDIGYAQGMAEDWVRQVRAERLTDRSAAWRSRPATERQVAALRAGAGSRWSQASPLDVALAGAALAPATSKQRAGRSAALVFVLAVGIAVRLSPLAPTGTSQVGEFDCLHRPGYH